MKSKKLEWEISDVNKSKLSIEEAKFIFEQAEKHLRQSIEISAKVVTRTTIMLTITIGILSSVFGFLFSNLNNSTQSEFTMLLALSICIYLFLLMLYLAYNISGKAYWDLGSEPKTLLHNHFMAVYPDDSKLRTVYYYLSEIVDYQDRIEKNKKINSKRWMHFHISLLCLLALPVLVALLYGLSIFSVC